jgi:hypothetical protein
MTSDRTFSDLRNPADDPQDEFARFQSDVQRAIEPLQNHIILHEAQSSWQEQLRQAGHAAASPRRQTILSVGTMVRVGVVSIGVAIVAISAVRLLGTDLTANHSFARFFEALTPGTPNPGDFTAPPDQAALSSQAQSAEGERGTPPDQTMQTQATQTQVTSSDAAPQPQPAELPPPSSTADDKDEAGPSKTAEAVPSSVDTTVPAPADVSGSPAVTMPPNDELERFRKFSEEQANREKVRTAQEQSSSKQVARQKALRHRRAQAARLALSSRNQSDRKDLGGEARQSVRPPR